MLVISILATTVIGADTGLFNGDAGLALIPNPLASVDSSTRGWYYVGLVAIVCVLGYLGLRRFTTGPMGRVLRAVREDEDAAIAVGKGVVKLRLAVQVVGGVFAGLSGALLAGFIGGWSPQSWLYVETLALLTAIIVGGLGNDAGVLVGTVIVPVLILQGVQFLPQIKSAPELTSDLGWIVLGLLTIAFVFTRPQGLIPERRPRYDGSRLQPNGLTRSLTRLRARLPASQAATVPTAAIAGSATAVAEAAVVLAEPSALLSAVAMFVPSPAQEGQATTANGSGAPILAVTGLVKRYGGVHAVDGATFVVDTGRITGLIGPNGAGKSTALGIISGFLRADAGQIIFSGRDIGRLSGPSASPARDRANLPDAPRVPRADHPGEPGRRRSAPAWRVSRRGGTGPALVARAGAVTCRAGEPAA